MRYALGVDLGTTFTGVAMTRQGHAEMITLGDNTVIEPTAVFIRDAGPPLTGDAAVRRALGDPTRISREFKRRLGDPTPLRLGGIPFSPTQLMATVLNVAVARVTELYGVPPERMVLSHPAVWGPYRRSQFAEVPELGGFRNVVTVPEPVAAATYYAASRQLNDGDIIAVYDLGGGTFDATVARMNRGDIEVLGDPEGVEWLGGIDFDEAVLDYVDRQLDGAVSGLDSSDPQQAVALFWLRQECVLAKEALSGDEEVKIRAFMPGGVVSVTLTRVTFEELIRPTLESTIQALHRALGSAKVKPADLSSVLLVGGSSRIPLVARLVEEAMQRPTAANLHPKHAVALGAALIAGRAMEKETGADTAPPAASRSDRRSGKNRAPTKATGAPEQAVARKRRRPGRRRLVAGLIALLIAAAVAGLAYGWSPKLHAAGQSRSTCVNCSVDYARAGSMCRPSAPAGGSHWCSAQEPPGSGT